MYMYICIYVSARRSATSTSCNALFWLLVRLTSWYKHVFSHCLLFGFDFKSRRHCRFCQEGNVINLGWTAFNVVKRKPFNCFTSKEDKLPPLSFKFLCTSLMLCNSSSLQYNQIDKYRLKHTFSSRTRKSKLILSFEKKNREATKISLP